MSQLIEDARAIFDAARTGWQADHVLDQVPGQQWPQQPTEASVHHYV